MITEALRVLGDADGIKLLYLAADRLEELQRLNDSMQTDRDLWIKVGREKLEAVEKKLTDSTNHYNAIIIELARERDETCAEVERLKAELQCKQTRPEPSRLEIAAQFMVGSFLGAGEKITNKQAFKMADALIAAAREAK